MRAKLGNDKVNVWQISMDKPENEDWLLEAFQMHQLAWSGKLVMDAKDKAKLKAQGMKGKVANPTEAALSWFLLYADIGSFSNAFPENIYLVVNQPRGPVFGKIGDYLVQSPLGMLEIYSEKKAKRELTFQ